MHAHGNTILFFLIYTSLSSGYYRSYTKCCQFAFVLKISHANTYDDSVDTPMYTHVYAHLFHLEKFTATRVE